MDTGAVAKKRQPSAARTGAKKAKKAGEDDDHGKAKNEIRKGKIASKGQPTSPTAEPKEDPFQQFKGQLTKDLRTMLYGFGDSRKPLDETVNLVEDIVIEYVTTVMYKTLENSAQRGGRTMMDDLLAVVRKDPRKYSRAKELVLMNEELKRARQAFKTDELEAAEEPEPPQS